MLQVTTTLSYGLRVLLNLAHDHKRPRRLQTIALEEGISLPYLRKLIVPLERAGIIKSLRGPGGGFILNRKPEEIGLLEVINMLSHNKVIGCVTGSKSCRRYEHCVVKGLLEEAYSKFQRVFAHKTLATIL